MNLTITTSTIDTAQASAAGAAPVLPSAEQAGLFPQAGAAVALDPTLTASLPLAQLPVLQFGQWLDQAAAVAETPVDPAGAASAADADLASTLAEQPAGEQLPADAVLLGAMAMPVLPLAQAAQATLAAVAAALPGAPAPSEHEPLAAQASGPAPTALASAGAAAQALLPEVSAQPANLPAPAAPGQQIAAAPRLDGAAQDAAVAKPQGQPAPASFAAVLGEAAKEQPAVAVVDRSAAPGAVIGTPAGQNAAAPDTVTLSGPPTAWRQNLREALGERLQLQVGRGAEQAVIRLDPPNLGQVEIAIRHSAGTLEVTISATHREVVRQLQAVSENMRSDLAQRQFTDVAVNVAPARQAGQATPFFGGDQQGRGRQPDSQQDEAVPGLALADAQQIGATFSLNARN